MPLSDSQSAELSNHYHSLVERSKTREKARGWGCWRRESASGWSLNLPPTKKKKRKKIWDVKVCVSALYLSVCVCALTSMHVCTSHQWFGLSCHPNNSFDQTTFFSILSSKALWMEDGNKGGRKEGTRWDKWRFSTMQSQWFNKTEKESERETYKSRDDVIKMRNTST